VPKVSAFTLVLLLQNNNDVVECAYLMIATLYLILTNIPTKYVESDLIKEGLSVDEIFTKLKDLFSVSDKDSVKISLQHLIKLIQKMKEKSYFSGMIMGQEIIGLKSETYLGEPDSQQVSFLDKDNIPHNI
jgi:hypothetical protein